MSDNLENLKLAELQSLIETINKDGKILKTSGTKQQLIERLKQHYSIIRITKNNYTRSELSNLKVVELKEIIDDINKDGKILDKNGDKNELVRCIYNYKNGIVEEEKVYNNKVTFFLFAKSKDGVYPGHGQNEKILKKRENDFSELSNIENWRRRLHDSYPFKFTCDGLEWASVEHYYHGSKFKKTNQELYESFSLKNESELSKDVKLAKKTYMQHKNSVDKSFETKSNKILKRAYKIKFKKGSEFAHILKCTKDAKLTSGSRGNNYTLNVMMGIRSTL